jgi:hypothetical protein
MIASQGSAITAQGSQIATTDTTVASVQTMIPANHVFLATLKREAAIKAGASGISPQGNAGSTYSESVMQAAINRINDLIAWDGDMAGTFNTLVDALVNAGIIDA